VEFADPSDAEAAVENMNDSELFGRVLKVNLAKPSSMRGGGGGGGAIWAGEQGEEWINGLDKTADSVDAAIAHQQHTEAKHKAAPHSSQSL
jgi:RNA recognition motif-containing protein